MQAQIKGTDSRSAIQKLHRYDLWRVAKAHGLPFKAGETADKMIQIITDAGIDVTQPLPDGGRQLFQQVMVEYEQGKFRPDVVAVVEPIATASQNIDYDAVMERARELREARRKADDAEAQNEELLSEVQQLRRELSQLKHSIAAQGRAKMKIPLEKRNVQTLRKQCRELGIELEIHEARDRQFMIAQIREAESAEASDDGENAT